MLLKLTPSLYFLNCILGDLRENSYSVPKNAQISLMDGPVVQLVFESDDFGLVRKFKISFQDTLREDSGNTLYVATSQCVPDNEVSLKDFDKSYSWGFYIQEGWNFEPLETMAEQLLAAALEFLEYASIPEHFNPTR